MANQPLAFAELLAGSVLVISAVTDRSIGETIRGASEPAPGSSSILKGKGSSSSTSTSGTGSQSGSTGGGGGSVGGAGPTSWPSGKLAPSPQQAAASVHRKPSLHQILALNRKLAAKGEHMTRKTLSRIANGELSISTLEHQLGL